MNDNNTYDVMVVGGGIAGIETAYNLSLDGLAVIVLEKSDNVGGHVRKWEKLFPDFTKANDVVASITAKSQHQNITMMTCVEITSLRSESGHWEADTADGRHFKAKAAVIATGFEVFDARRKEELGYGIYDNVITSVDFEAMYKTGSIHTVDGRVPQKIAFLNCVGSRDEKVGNHYCSRVCCINAVKQATEFKILYPEAEAFVFYMDLRMAGQFYEELYRKSQEKYSVNYVRGRISEVAPTLAGKLQIKSEDTLLGLPLKMTVDILVLMVGIEASDGTTQLARQNGIEGEYGFAQSSGLYGNDNLTACEGLFVAGVCKRPLTIPETIADAGAAARHVITYLKHTQP